MNALPDALDALVQKSGYKNLNQYLGFRTSRKLPFITDTWGNEDVTHFELHHLGKTLQVTCLPDKIKINGFVKVTQTAMNAFEITNA